MKPGKPFTFAEIVAESGENTKVDKILAFGLPGNPVSCLVCFHLFVVPSIRHIAGWKNPYPLRLLKFKRIDAYFSSTPINIVYTYQTLHIIKRNRVLIDII